MRALVLQMTRALVSVMTLLRYARISRVEQRTLKSGMSTDVSAVLLCVVTKLNSAPRPPRTGSVRNTCSVDLLPQMQEDAHAYQLSSGQM